jgi:hypothetical protein
VDGVEVEVGAGVEGEFMVIEIYVAVILGVQAMTQAVRAGVDTTTELEVVIRALREVVVGVDSTGELEVVIQSLREVVVGVDPTGELEVVNQALRARMMVTEEEGGARIKKVL